MFTTPDPLFYPTPPGLRVSTFLCCLHSCRQQFKGVKTMQMVIKERASLAEAVMAFILLMSNYRKKGYFSQTFTLKNLCTLAGRFCDYMHRVHRFNNDHSRGQVIVAKKFGLVIGTVCVELNPEHLSINDVFPAELSSLRNSNESFIYLGSFAVAPAYKCTRLSLRMLRHVWSMVQRQGIDVGVCVVHPDHVSFYERFGFTKIAQSTMPGLEKAPAALLVIKRHEVLL
jgi:ribosomal protein S18 acetylase RimI-like enzyme